MSQIRKNSIKATIWVYIGFLIGAINTYFLTHKSWFTTDQNGLTRSMIELSNLAYAFSTLGTISYLIKFFPYYKDNVEDKKNDILGLALIISLIGFIITASSLVLLQPLAVRKFSEHSILLVEYFFWIIPMSFFILLYSILDAYSLGFQKGVVTSMLKETVLRFYTLFIILLKIFDIIDFRLFIILFSLQYLIITIALAIHLYAEGKLLITFKPSNLTKKFRKKIIAIMAFTFIVIIVSVLRQSIDGIVLAAKQNLGKVGIFGLASYLVSVLQAPFRSIVAVTIPLLSKAWKNKNMNEIQRIYQRSSINMLGFSLLVFFCIWLNFENGIYLLNINSDYIEGKWVFFLLGMVTIIEVGTGVNAQIIGTSTFWRFELLTSLLLTAFIIPLSYMLTVTYGITGPAIANLISFSLYNLIRYVFLLKKFNLQPFSSKTLELLLISIFSYFAAYYLTKDLSGLIAIISSISIFCAIYVPLFYWRNISPDVKQLMETFTAKFRK